jgi:hypothetical protein
MSEVLKMLEDLENRLWARFGNPLAKYTKTQTDVHMTYYVGRLMEELGKALHDAFLAGQLLARKSNQELAENIRAEIKAELKSAIDEL